MTPRRRLQCPDALRITLLELLGQLAKHSMIIRYLVTTDTFPVQRFRRSLRVRKTLEHLCISLLGVRPLFVHKRNAR